MASELPRIAKSASMDPNYRSAYCTASNGGGNLKTVYGESFPCEPIFVQRPSATQEDDCIVINKQGTHRILVALDGTSSEEVARAR
ncbi:hypothetical protein VDGD_20044 [Verticillium dahliae]|nr:hypothetical protein VDGD_20044 [Verticillium dahliae]